MNRKTKKDGHKPGPAVLVRMSQEQREEIDEAVRVVVDRDLPRGARLSVTAWILAQALEAARAVKTGVEA